MTSGSAPAGAATMAAFGLGTLPMLLAMGSAAAAVARAAKVRGVRMAAGLAIVGFGLLHLVYTEQAWASAGPPDAHLCSSHAH
jgi:sulfite exporter TauE/SafE